MQLPESEWAMAAVKNIHPQLRERLVAIEYFNLGQLTSQASRVK